MDMKKKLEDAYIPDKQSRKEKVVVALSGGIDSLVTAYLLKIQKYDLMAVTVLNSWEELPGDQGKYFSCHITPQKLEQMKDFCNRLNIPLSILKASSEFREEVIDPWIADRILAKRPKQCWTCHELRINLVYAKMKEMGAKKFATGHYAKLFHNESHGTVFVHTSNDEGHDQSALLSTLSHEVLSHLILPLSDLTRKEVLKLAENFGVTHEEKPLPMHACLPPTEDLNVLLTKKISKRFLKEGDIMNPDGTEQYGQHEGIVGHTIGDSMDIREGGKTMKGVFGTYNYPEKKMVIYPESFFVRNNFLLKNCHFSEEVTLAEPVRGYVLFSQDQSEECWIHPKSLSSVFIELTGSHKIFNGDIVSVVKKKGRNAKIFLTGEIELLPPEPEKEEGEEGVPKVNSAFDF